MISGSAASLLNPSVARTLSCKLWLRTPDDFLAARAKTCCVLPTQGGCFMVTSRILVLDLLNEKINAGKITGVIVNQAHRVTDTSTEAFIIRLYR
jgi:hypothetical protein